LPLDVLLKLGRNYRMACHRIENTLFIAGTPDRSAESN
jgi:hypothetical protein